MRSTSDPNWKNLKCTECLKLNLRRRDKFEIISTDETRFW